MFFTRGVSIYNLPDWLTSRVILFEHEMADGSWIEITLPVLVMLICVVATWLFITRTTTGRQLYAFGDNPEGARRFGINIGAMQFIAFGWLGLMAGIAGLIQAHYAQEVVPNALYGRELDVLAAVVLGGARLGGGKGSVLGCVLGVLLDLDHAERPQPGGRLALCLQDDRRRHHPGRHHAVEHQHRKAAAVHASGWRPQMTALLKRSRVIIGPEMAGPGLALFIAVLLFFSLASPQFLSRATFGSVAFQLPELGLLTLAMLLPVLTGGLNLAITFTANIAGLTLAWVLQANGGVDAGPVRLLPRQPAALSASARRAAW